MYKRILLLIVLSFPLSGYAATETANFAMGCFWCAQSDFDKLPGVIKTTVGYDGGTTLNPTYESVSAGTTNYAESIQVTFDDTKVTYPQVLNYFWHHIDPTTQDAQFCDHGHQYRSAIFYLTPTQKQQALASLDAIKKQFPTVYTEITPSTTFYPAETYHQDYYKKNPVRYHYYRWRCGRDARVTKIWGDKND
ncbi:MAG: peptide-methionine (S)-S-oxide reductase MsrA [Gammaproteobacteria bacterium]|nr:peptide-methionine (S)-S-oxide reductase MsrA [Gammaproteobacteria bacterium]